MTTVHLDTSKFAKPAMPCQRPRYATGEKGDAGRSS